MNLFCFTETNNGYVKEVNLITIVCFDFRIKVLALISFVKNLQ